MSEYSRIEFDVNLTCQNCANSVQAVLTQLEDTTIVDIDVEKQRVVVDTNLPSRTIKETIQKTGKIAVLKGFGKDNTESAVAELKGTNGIVGVIRFHQTNDGFCVIDGTIDGLVPGEHGLHIHEYGDISKGCDSIGPHYNPAESSHGDKNDKIRHYGDLGNIQADTGGRASFRIDDPVVKIPDIIGRSVCVTEKKDDLGKGENKLSKIDGNSGKGLACAIVARSAGLFKNPKRICQCDGISVWDENKAPAASL